MSAKRIVKWVIVLFLLAALRGFTAVMAQGVNLAERDAGSAVEPAAATNCNVGEVESNNSRRDATSLRINDVACGLIDSNNFQYTCESADWFRFHMPSDGYVLVEYRGGPYTWLSLYDASGNLSTSDGKWLDGGYGSYGEPSVAGLMFENLYAGDYYLKIYYAENGHSGTCGGNYRLTVSSPLLISAYAGNFRNGGMIDGIKFYSEDILAYSQLNNGENRWRMFFDGSKAGIRKNVTNIAASRHGDSVAQNKILLSVANAPYDIYVFTPHGVPTGDAPSEGYGWYTSGSVDLAFGGQAYDLTTSGEKLDAIDGWVNGHDSCYGFPVSTSGVANTQSWGNVIVRADDEDVFCKIYDNGWGPWRYFFDNKGPHNAPSWWQPAPVRVPGLAREDVIALAYDDARDVMYMTIQGTGTIWGHRVTQKDIFAINFPDYTWGGIVWHGPDHGWNYNIDAIEWNGP